MYTCCQRSYYKLDQRVGLTRVCLSSLMASHIWHRRLILSSLTFDIEQTFGEKPLFPNRQGHVMAHVFCFFKFGRSNSWFDKLYQFVIDSAYTLMRSRLESLRSVEIFSGGRSCWPNRLSVLPARCMFSWMFNHMRDCRSGLVIRFVFYLLLRERFHKNIFRFQTSDRHRIKQFSIVNKIKNNLFVHVFLIWFCWQVCCCALADTVARCHAQRGRCYKRSELLRGGKSTLVRESPE